MVSFPTLDREVTLQPVVSVVYLYAVKQVDDGFSNCGLCEVDDNDRHEDDPVKQFIFETFLNESEYPKSESVNQDEEDRDDAGHHCLKVNERVIAIVNDCTL